MLFADKRKKGWLPPPQTLGQHPFPGGANVPRPFFILIVSQENYASNGECDRDYYYEVGEEIKFHGSDGSEEKANNWFV
jgi:hypothetical protein